MNKKEKQAWRTIVAILQETGYDNLYDEEVHIVAECLRRCEQQCKKQKEIMDNVINIINQHFKHHPELLTENQIEYELIRKIENILKEASK